MPSGRSRVDFSKRSGARTRLKLTNSFHVPVGLESTWTVLNDIERIVPCMPGASLSEVVDESTYKGVGLGSPGSGRLVVRRHRPVRRGGRGQAPRRRQDSWQRCQGARAASTRTLRSSFEPDEDGYACRHRNRPPAVGSGGPVRPRRGHGRGGGVALDRGVRGVPAGAACPRRSEARPDGPDLGGAEQRSRPADAGARSGSESGSGTLSCERWVGCSGEADRRLERPPEAELRP